MFQHLMMCIQHNTGDKQLTSTAPACAITSLSENNSLINTQTLNPKILKDFDDGVSHMESLNL
jgi:hypothetical protein